MKILVAEDNAIWRAVVKRQIESWGHEPVVVEDGVQAWSVLERDDAPRLAILDWQMPGLDGIDVCKRVKRDPNHAFTYIIILTSRDAQEDMVAGLDAGADDYLTKPIQPSVLRSRIAAAERIVRLVPPKEWATPRIEGYDVKRVLGKGVFATVWEAFHESTGQTVALKIIRVDLATDEVFGRFAREVELMKKLDHRNIARIYDSRIDKALAYYSMELITGGTLDEFVQKRSVKPAAIIYLLAKVAEALDHAHRQGVIHRDLKPRNIMMTEGGEPKLVDFGLARSMFHTNIEDSALHSMDGTVIGTPLFMSPEQALGKTALIDGRSDIFGLGIILFVMLVRKNPYRVPQSDPWGTIREAAEHRLRRPSELRPGFDPDLEAIIMRAIAHKPEDRYATGAELSRALRDFLKERSRANAQESASE
jgi:serine/threonine protein kinase